jgi:hypothetical protein
MLSVPRDPETSQKVYFSAQNLSKISSGKDWKNHSLAQSLHHSSTSASPHYSSIGPRQGKSAPAPEV